MTLVGPSDDELKVVQLYATRVRQFAIDTGRAYAFDIQPGILSDVTSGGFVRELIPLELETVPRGQVAALARQCLLCADIMAERRPPPQIADSWRLLARFLTTYGVEAASFVSLPLETAVDVAKVDPASPSVLRFDLIAALTNEPAIVALAEHAERVGSFCRSNVAEPFDDRQKQLLRELAAGRSVLNIATQYGYSERSLYRECRRMWSALGAANRSTAIATASRLGYLDDRPPN